MYAIIATGGKQYKVSEGDIITIEKLGVEAGETVTFDQVLAVSDSELKVGNPTVAGATVTASVVKEGRGKKVIVYKYKRKTGYHKKNGHRQSYTRVKIDTEDYRRRRKETLENLAKNVAMKVKRTKKSVSLEAMNPYERRIIHSALQNDQYVSTHSEGEEPYRYVVVTLKK